MGASWQMTDFEQVQLCHFTLANGQVRPEKMRYMSWQLQGLNNPSLCSTKCGKLPNSPTLDRTATPQDRITQAGKRPLDRSVGPFSYCRPDPLIHHIFVAVEWLPSQSDPKDPPDFETEDFLSAKRPASARALASPAPRDLRTWIGGDGVESNGRGSNVSNPSPNGT